MNQPSETKWRSGLLVSADLIFTTKITGTARELGMEVQVASSPNIAMERLRASPPSLLLLDLGMANLTAEMIREFVAAQPGTPIVAFGSHVDTSRLEAASAAGCTEVMPRSRFSATLPLLLAKYLRDSR